jgi:hypothetical protein
MAKLNREEAEDQTEEMELSPDDFAYAFLDMVEAKLSETASMTFEVKLSQTSPHGLSFPTNDHETSDLPQVSFETICHQSGTFPTFFPPSLRGTSPPKKPRDSARQGQPPDPPGAEGDSPFHDLIEGGP